jgi:hypothetical protein
MAWIWVSHGILSQRAPEEHAPFKWADYEWSRVGAEEAGLAVFVLTRLHPDVLRNGNVGHAMTSQVYWHMVVFSQWQSVRHYGLER